MSFALILAACHEAPQHLDCEQDVRYFIRQSVNIIMSIAARDDGCLTTNPSPKFGWLDDAHVVQQDARLGPTICLLHLSVALSLFSVNSMSCLSVHAPIKVPCQPGMLAKP